MARDIYSRLNELDDAMLSNVVQMLEKRGNHPQQIAIRKAYLDALGDLTGLSVLEIGCGTGVITRDLANRVGDRGRIVGSDPSAGMIAVARQLADDAGLRGLQFEVQDARELPYSDGTFDLVVVVTVLSHVTDPVSVLREVTRVTKPGGRVLIVDGDFAANQIEHPDRETTAKIITAWRANVVNDPYLTRRLGPLLDAAGLRMGAVHGHIHIEAGRVDEASSFLLQWTKFASNQAVLAGALTEEQATTWTDEVLTMNRHNVLFGSITFVSVVGERP
jgi:arsenite methyltransferase